MPEFRRDPFSGRIVLIAAERAERPNEFTGEGSAICPFCEGNEASTPPEIFALRGKGGRPDTPGWNVRVVPNKFPALADEPVAEPGGEAWPARGVHEVVIESPRHATTVGELGGAQLAEALGVMAARVRELRKRPGVRAVVLFRNQGRGGGASLAHAHSQLMAMPLAPAGFEREWLLAKSGYSAGGECSYCRSIQQDCQSGERIVASSRGFVAIAPFAPRFSYETWIFPKHHEEHFGMLADEPDGTRELAELLISLSNALEAVTGEASTNLLLYDAPVESGAGEYWHWRLVLFPRIAQIAGFEFAAEMHVSVVGPETAAERLRRALGACE